MSISLPETAIIIPTCGRPEPLRRCLDAIVPYVSRHPECTIVVSIDGEAAEIVEMLHHCFPIVRVVKGPNRGPAANRNSGAASSEGSLLIFLDDDCIPEPALISVYQQAAVQYPATDVFEGRTSAQGTPEGFGDCCPENETGGYLWSCNFAIRRELFTNIGGFDERFPFAAMEDVDLRLRLEGKSSLRFLTDARVFHPIVRRMGWKRIRHGALSLLLYSHIRGMERTRLGPFYYAHVIAHLVRDGGQRLLRGKQSKNPEQLLKIIWMHFLMLLITLFWRSHPYLAKVIFPPCCRGCESVHHSLAGPAA